jgi:hypothetical protein
MDSRLQDITEKIQNRDLLRAIAKIAHIFAPLCMHFIDWIIAQKPHNQVRFMLRDGELFFETAKTMASVSPRYKICADWTADYLTNNMLDHIPDEYLKPYLDKNWNQSMTMIDVGCEGGLVNALRRFFPDNDYFPLFLGSDNPDIPGFLNESAGITEYMDNFKKSIAEKKVATYKSSAAAFAILLEHFPKKEFSPHTLCHRRADGSLYIMNDFNQYVLCPDESKPYLYLQNPGLPQINNADGDLHIRPENKFHQAAHKIFFDSLRAAVTEYGRSARPPSVGDAVARICEIAPGLKEIGKTLIPHNEDGISAFESVHKKEIAQILKVR